MKTLKKTIILLVIFLVYSCSNTNNLDTINNKIIKSTEYKTYVEAFKKLNQIDLEISSKSMEQVRNGKTTKKIYVENFNNLITPSKKGNTIDYFRKIGIPNAEKLISDREYIFNEIIPKAINDLGVKFPILKNYSTSEMKKLRELSIN